MGLMQHHIRICVPKLHYENTTCIYKCLIVCYEAEEEIWGKLWNCIRILQTTG